MQDFLSLIQERVAVYDGAMGTNIQVHAPTVDDYWGKEGCNELLVLSRPDIIRSIHASFFEVGCDVVETNSFGSTRIVLAEYELEDKTHELNLAAAKLAKDVARQYSTPERPRFVAGSIGPTTKLPSLGHITYDAMAEGYREQAAALIEGGVDILLIETSQDLLQAKICLAACQDAMRAAGRELPIQMQVTLEATGTMLLGSEIGAALAVLECFNPAVIGLNCATGPAEMNDAVRFLCQNATRPISVLPNAGLPQNVGGHAVYALTPKELGAYHRRFVTEYGVQVVGGCCGTTPEHLRAVVEAVKDATPAPRHVKPQGVAASAFSAVPLEVDGQPVIVAEEMNTTTRVAHFRDMVRAGDYDGILALAKRLAAEGSQMLDLCCAIVGEDEKGYMNAVLEKIATRVTAPVLVDSTEADVIEEALKRIPGKPIINSINLEDGEKRTSRVLPMAKRYGAAVIALTIDEDGMALTADKKVAIAKRIYQMATERYGLRGVDILFDPLTLPISTGQEDYRTAGIETLEAVRRIKQELPEAKTILGVSNISFGLSAYSRRVLNSVFLKEAVDRGLDAAIVNYSKIYPLYKIPDEEVELARRLIFHDTSNGDPLQLYMAHFSGKDKNAVAEDEVAVESLSDDDKLKQLIIRGERSIGQGAAKQSLEDVIELALARYSPLDLINTVLLDGMKTVGELFGARKMQLPSVLDSAAVMKAAVAYLEPRMEKVEGTQKGTIVLATVKGDVHDIGKNLVDIILSNNGYKVVNLGIKQPADVIIQAAQEHKADAIGLSGLLVKSTLEMKYVIQDLERMALEFPVICGGAALTRKYVEDDLRKEYSSAVFYAEDAFAGLHVMTDLTTDDEETRSKRLTDGRTVKAFVKPTHLTPESELPAETTARSGWVTAVEDIPTPPFYGVRVKKDFNLDEVFGYINETALFKNQWQLKTASATDYLRLVEEKYRPILEDLKAEIKEKGWFEPKLVYGFYPANADGNDLVVYEPEDASKERLRISFPRQREGRQLSIADFFEPRESVRKDVVGFSVVTIGDRASEETKKLFEAGDFTRYLYVHGLGVETAEALAELAHKHIRQELGIAGEDAPRVTDLFHQKYRGSRYSFGYPACPNLEDQTKIFTLLEPEKNIGVRLTEGFHLEPEQSTNAIIVHHPQAKYFVV
ncbi:methionine synthase [Acidipila rosea]|uniref:Methionine synthase n=1 Tax=Acidipila rosea TaxID=768535 RepID=A0A4R1LEY3_9BACT|nr:methionine synthase [Acidipila rosea]TCK75209.1 methionine synthase (B12-dependent) [Acidipila rosea]